MDPFFVGFDFYNDLEFWRWYFRQKGRQLVISHWRAQPGMKDTGIQDVFIDFYTRRFPGCK
jgi:hypothetical protein